MKSCSNESHAFEVNENWASLTRGRKSIDARSYIYIYRVVQSLRNLEIEVVAVSNTRTFLPAKRNLEETCPILSIFRGELWAITTPSSPSLSLSLTHGLFATFVWYTKLATIFPATTVSIRFGACLGCTIRRDIDRMSVTSDITRRSSRSPRDRA